MTMKLSNLKARLVSFSSASIASLCCLLPLAVVLLGLGSGAFMIVTMKYRAIFLPLGVIGLALGYYLYFREKRRCTHLGCALAGAKINLALLFFATVIVAWALVLDIFPELTSNILQGAM
jgi:hypothetical protein